MSTILLLTIIIVVVVVIVINIGVIFVFDWLSGTQNKTGKQPVVVFFLSLNQKPYIYMNLADRAGLDERKFGINLSLIHI